MPENLLSRTIFIVVYCSARNEELEHQVVAMAVHAGSYRCISSFSIRPPAFSENDHVVLSHPLGSPVHPFSEHVLLSEGMNCGLERVPPEQRMLQYLFLGLSKLEFSFDIRLPVRQRQIMAPKDSHKALVEDVEVDCCQVEALAELGLTVCNLGHLAIFV